MGGSCIRGTQKLSSHLYPPPRELCLVSLGLSQHRQVS